jgi:hypothetical protein
MTGLKLDEPKDVRALIRQWLREVSETGNLPFQNGGVIVQLLNTWLKSYELEKISVLEGRLVELEEIQKRDTRRGLRGR